MDKANQRIKSLQHDLSNIKKTADQLKDEDDSDDDDDDSGEAIRSEIKALEKENAVRQDKLDEYEKNKTCTWRGVAWCGCYCIFIWIGIDCFWFVYGWTNSQFIYCIFSIQ